MELIKGAITGDFDLIEYLKQKAVSLAVSLLAGSTTTIKFDYRLDK